MIKTLEEVYVTMQAEHSAVMRMLGHIEGRVESLAEKQVDLKVAQAGHLVLLTALTSEVRSYRSYFIGFMAAVSLITSAAWWVVTNYFTKAT